MFRWFVILVILLGIAGVATYVVAGRTTPPTLLVEKPDRAVGQKSTLEVVARAPGSRFASLTIALEQGGRTIPLFSLDAPAAATMTPIDADSVRISRPFGKQAVPELEAGAARIVATATRKSFLDLRTVSSTTAKDIQVQLVAPRVSAVSTHHYVNHGGAEMVVYRVSPPGGESGVRVGAVEHRGFPAAGAGASTSDASTMVAFFALLHDQDLATPISLFARDEAGNESTSAFVDKVFPKPFRKSRIQLDEGFLRRVVPEIAARSVELNLPAPEGELLPGFLRINGDLRRMNAARIEAIAARTSPTRLWQGPFVQLGQSQVEASFADHRTYVYGGKDVDRQVHLGFDLASTARAPVVAANAGKVLFADWLGIYGECVILDHGMGIGSLYGHLSSIDVKPDEAVRKGQPLGRSGLTGMAGGDHLHFTMLVHGRPVNPVEWWDPHWIEDRVERKLR